MTQLTPSYVNRDFDGLVSELTRVISHTRPDLLSDLSDASLGVLIRDLLAFVGDNANYAIDSAAIECFLSTCRRLDSARAHAKSFGYVLRPAAAATCDLAPDNIPAEITQYGGVIAKGSTIRVNKSVVFEATEDIYIPVNAISTRITLTEGTSYDETLATIAGPSPKYTVSNVNVAAASWHVYINSVEWTEVEDVTREISASNTYSVDFDSMGRLQIQFGDGVAGAVPVTAPRVTYRSCAGAAGNIPSRGVRGALPVTYTPSGGSATTVRVTFENYIVTDPVYGELAPRLDEALYASGLSNVQTLAIPRYPLKQQTLRLHIAGTTGAMVIVDSLGDGTLALESNTIPGVELISGTVVHSSGLVTLTFKKNATTSVVLNGAGVRTAPSGVLVSDGGAGYPNSGTISFTGGGGSGAAGTYTAVNGVITSTTVTAAGSGYTTPPTAVFSGETAYAVRWPPYTSPYYASYYYFTQSVTRSVSVLGAAVGGIDREGLAELRRNVQSFIKTGGRMVAYADYRQGLLRTPGVALAHAERFRSASLGSVASVYTWGLEQATLVTKGDGGGTVSVPYNRYATINPSIAGYVQRTLRDRALMTVQHVIQQPGMLWLDMYLGDVEYDSVYTAAAVRQNIANTAVKFFQSASGFDIRLASFASAIVRSPGVRHAGTPRIAMGYGAKDGVREPIGATIANATQTGTITRDGLDSGAFVISPGSLTIYIEQGSDTLVLIDDGSGNLVRSRGGVSLTSGTVNYKACTFTATFSSALSANGAMTATFDDVAEDLRQSQEVIIGSASFGDYWPPVSVSVSDPVVTPPYTDGFPLTVNGSPYVSSTPVLGDTLKYGPLRDILLSPSQADSAYYDDTYYYSDGILYSSTGVATDVVKAINLRNITFNLVAV